MIDSNLSLLERLRIERVVWALDQRLYEIPRRSRIAIRRDVRTNLRAAATEVGVRTAIRNVGNGSLLAGEYIKAEFGDAPRQSWIAAALFALTVPFVLTPLLTDAALAYADGVRKNDPHFSGTAQWPGIDYLQTEVTYTFTDGQVVFYGGAFTPLTWALLAIGTIAVGRLWRALPWWRRAYAGPASTADLS